MIRCVLEWRRSSGYSFLWLGLISWTNSTISNAFYLNKNEPLVTGLFVYRNSKEQWGHKNLGQQPKEYGRYVGAISLLCHPFATLRLGRLINLTIPLLSSRTLVAYTPSLDPFAATGGGLQQWKQLIVAVGRFATHRWRCRSQYRCCCPSTHWCRRPCSTTSPLP